jgi:hypothetical protein
MEMMYKQEELDIILRCRLAVMEGVVAIYERIAIVAPPKHGKTTLAKALKERYESLNVIHCDEYISHSWTEQPLVIIEEVAKHKEWLIEGVQVARAMRKGLRPDAVVVLEKQLQKHTPKQAQLARNVMSWMEQGFDQLCNDRPGIFSNKNIIFLR